MTVRDYTLVNPSLRAVMLRVLDSRGNPAQLPVPSGSSMRFRGWIEESELRKLTASATSVAPAPSLDPEVAKILARKADLYAGKLQVSQVPDLAIASYLGVVANQTAMLQLQAQNGDWCFRSDVGAYFKCAGPADMVGSWQNMFPDATQVYSPYHETSTESVLINLTEAVSGKLGFIYHTSGGTYSAIGAAINLVLSTTPVFF